MQPKRKHARTSNREAHLEPHDRLADHREQPRRQRDQLRRELRVRHAGSDRRRRPPVPRKQHRHEQLQPLQHHIRSFSRTRARAGRRTTEGALCRQQRIPRCVLSRGGIPVECVGTPGVPREYSGFTPGVNEYP